jgi:hypothetical protein
MLLDLLKRDGIRAVMANATDDEPLVLLRCLIVSEMEEIESQISVRDQARLAIAQRDAIARFKPCPATILDCPASPEVLAAVREIEAEAA